MWMATTCTACVLRGTDGYVCHAGDSRAYLFRGGSLRQVTEDHTLVNRLLQDGLLTEEAARNHPQRNILARALGSNEEVEVDTSVSVLGRGCKILLCTDGLYTMVSEARIQEVMALGEHPQILAGRLVAEANDGGGRDNVTVLMIQIT